MTLTVTHTGPIAGTGLPAGQQGNAVPGDQGNDIFGSLLATLFSLVAPQLTEEQTAALEKLGLTPEGADAPASFNGTNFLADLEEALTAAGATPDAPATPGQLVNSLVSVLQKLEGTVPTESLTDAAEAVDVINQLLANAPELITDPADSTAPIAVVATAQTPVPTQSEGAKAATSTPASTQPSSVPPAQIEAQINALLQLAEKFTKQSPELSAKLTELVEKLQQMAPPPPAGTTPKDAELQQTLQALFGEKQATGKASNTPIVDTTPKAATTGQDKPAAQPTAPIDSTKMDFNPARAVAQATQSSATQTQAPQAPVPGTQTEGQSTSAAATAANAAQLAKADKSPQTDPLLLAQANNQSVVKADAVNALKPMTAAYQTPTPNLNMPRIAFEVASAHQAGVSKFQIRLDPPEMGRIDVKLNVDGAGNLHARMTVERAETLDLMQRDARTLERALQQAGIDSGKTNLEFSLKQNPFARQDGQSQNGGQSDGSKFSLEEADAESNIVDIPAAAYYRGTASPGGINMVA